MMSVFDLNNINGKNGFAINGTVGGILISGIGDFNGDNVTDVIIGAPNALGWAGECYIIFGSKNGFNKTFNIDDLNGTNGFIFQGITSDYSDFVGTSASGAGDINDDGFDDIVISASGITYDDDKVQTSGQYYIIYGNNKSFPRVFNRDYLDGKTGVIIDAWDICASGTSGMYASGIGDFNGDNIDDIAFMTGDGCILFGNESGYSSPFLLDSINSDTGVVIFGAKINDVGNNPLGSCDINNDGLNDLIIGDGTDDNYAGKVYVVFGSKEKFTMPFYLSSLNGENGFIIDEINSNQLGTTLSGSQDINGDSVDDLIIGAAWVTDDKTSNVYVVFGHRGAFSKDIHIFNLNGTNGFGINEIVTNDNVVISVNQAGDINSDGLADIIVGAPGVNYDRGNGYIIFGRNSSFSASININDLNYNDGFIINSTKSQEYLGQGVSGIGDMNGDGFDDIAITAVGDEESYVIFGRPDILPSPSTTPSVTPTSSPSTTPSVGASINPSYEPSLNPSPHHNNPDNSALTTAEAAGIGVGGAVVIGAIVGLAWYGKTHGWCAGGHDDLTLPLNEGEA